MTALPPQRLTFCRVGDVTTVLGGWPRRIAVADELLRGADPALMRRDGDRLWFAVANGTALYRLEAVDLWGQQTVWHLVEGRMEDPR